MPKILIAQRYKEVDFVQNGLVDLPLTDFLIARNYLPICATFQTNSEDISQIQKLVCSYLDLADAVILQGGSDVCPSFYDQTNYFARGVVRFRDFFELEIIKQAVAKKLPILGICRGMQLLNIFFGGNLYQDLVSGKWQKHSFSKLSSDYENQSIIANSKKHHTVNLTKSGFLFQSLQVDNIWVNSFHHQGIDKLGQNLQIEAQSEDGLVEAFTNISQKIVGVQWHPELTTNDPNSIRFLESWLQLIK